MFACAILKGKVIHPCILIVKIIIISGFKRLGKSLLFGLVYTLFLRRDYFLNPCHCMRNISFLLRFEHAGSCVHKYKFIKSIKGFFG